MCARFSVTFTAYAILNHLVFCVTVNQDSGSRIIADFKEEIPLIVINSKLNNVLTIYVPIVNGTEALYYLTNPRGEETKLNVKYINYKKKIKKPKNHNVSKTLVTKDGHRDLINDIYVRKHRKFSSAKLDEAFNDNINIKYNTHHNLSLKRPQNVENIKKHLKLFTKEKLEHNDKYYKKFINKFNHTDKQLNSHRLEMHKKQLIGQRSKSNNILRITIKNQITTNKFLNKAISKYGDINQPISDAEPKKEAINSKLPNKQERTKNEDIKVYLNEEVTDLNISEFDDEIYGKARELNPNFQIGPLMEEDHGNWVLSVYYKNESSWVEMYQVININIYEHIPATPRAVKLKEGSAYILGFSYPIKHLQSCELISPKTAADKYYERYGQHPEYCGYIVKNVSRNEEGTWRIVGVGRIVYEAYSILQVGEGQFNFSTLHNSILLT